MATASASKRPTTRRRRPSTASAAEIKTNTKTSVRLLSTGIIALYVFASIISFFGLNAVGSYFLPPFWSAAMIGMIDLSIGVYKYAEIQLRQDPRKEHLASRAHFGVLLGTILSSLGNVGHIIVLADPDPFRFWLSLLFSGASPWLLYLAASVLTDVLVKPRARKVKSNVSRETSPSHVKRQRKPARKTLTNKDPSLPPLEHVEKLATAVIEESKFTQSWDEVLDAPGR